MAEPGLSGPDGGADDAGGAAAAADAIAAAADRSDWGALPEAVLVSVLTALPDARDMAAAGATCRRWWEAHAPLFRPRALARWATWPRPRPPPEDHRAWRREYARRHELDRSVEGHLRSVCWPLERARCMAAVAALGSEAAEPLGAAAVEPGPSSLGRRHWARALLQHLAGERAAAWVDGAAVEAAGGEDGDVGGAAGRGVPYYGEAVLEAALEVARVLEPLADVEAVRRVVGALCEELRARMAAAGVEGGDEALKLLSQLLCAPPPPAVDSDAAAAAVAGQLAARGSNAGADAARVPPPWRRDQPPEDLCGPSLEGVVVPQAPHGLGLAGNSSSYYTAANSLLPDVLARRRGIPITLCVLHCAVGRAAGLDVHLVNCPGHLVNRFTPGGSGSGGGGGDGVRYVDVFDGGRVMTREEFGAFCAGRGINLGSGGCDAWPRMSAGAVCARMVRNLMALGPEATGGSVWREAALLTFAAAVGRKHEPVWQCTALFAQMNTYLRSGEVHLALEVAERLRDAAHPSGAGPDHQLLASVDLEGNVDALRAGVRARQASANAVSLRDGHQVLCRVGDVMRHRAYHYRGAIVAWDMRCRQTADWIRQMNVAQLPGGADQPFYHVLVDLGDRTGSQMTYVAQCNIHRLSLDGVAAALAAGALDGSSASVPGTAIAAPAAAAAAASPPMPSQRPPSEVQHDELGVFFDGFDPTNGRYMPNAWLRSCYPQDGPW